MNVIVESQKKSKKSKSFLHISFQSFPLCVALLIVSAESPTDGLSLLLLRPPSRMGRDSWLELPVLHVIFVDQELRLLSPSSSSSP